MAGSDVRKVQRPIWAALTALLLTAMITSLFLAGRARQSAEATAAARAQVAVQDDLAPLLTPSDIAQPVAGERYQMLSALVTRRLLSAGPSDGVTLYSGEATVLFDVERGMVGRRRPELRARIDRVLNEGRESVVEGDTFHAFVPLRLKAEDDPVAVVDVTQPYEPLWIAASKPWRLAAIAFAALLLPAIGLLAVSLRGARRGDRTRPRWAPSPAAAQVDADGPRRPASQPAVYEHPGYRAEVEARRAAEQRAARAEDTAEDLRRDVLQLRAAAAGADSAAAATMQRRVVEAEERTRVAEAERIELADTLHRTEMQRADLFERLDGALEQIAEARRREAGAPSDAEVEARLAAAEERSNASEERANAALERANAAEAAREAATRDMDKRLEAAERRAADAEGALAATQARLADAQDEARAAAEQLAETRTPDGAAEELEWRDAAHAAEERVEAVRRAEEAAAARAAAAEDEAVTLRAQLALAGDDLRAERERAATSAARADAAEERLRSAAAERRREAEGAERRAAERPEVEDVLRITKERLQRSAERLQATEERAHAAEREVDSTRQRIEELEGVLRREKLHDALQHLRGDDQQTASPPREERRASAPFMQALSLDARNSVAAIQGLVLAMKHSERAEDRPAMLRRLNAHARKLDRLVGDLLDADRLARGEMELKVRRTDIQALARRVLEECAFDGDRDVRIESEKVVVAVDPVRVEGILVALLNNSVDRSRPRHDITVRVRAHDGGALISVEDDEPSSDASLSPVVSRFADVHGGWALVESGPGGGSAFRVFLPDHDAETVRTTIAPEQDTIEIRDGAGDGVAAEA